MLDTAMSDYLAAAGQRVDPPPLPMAATAERLALAVELDESHRPEDWSPTLDWIGYADELEHIASDALGHCQRLERELDDLRRAHAEEPVTRMDAVELEVRRLRRELTEVKRVAHEPVTFIECPTCKALVVEADGALEVHRRSHEPAVIKGPVPADPASDPLQAAFRAQEEFRTGQDTPGIGGTPAGVIR